LAAYCAQENAKMRHIIVIAATRKVLKKKNSKIQISENVIDKKFCKKKNM